MNAIRMQMCIETSFDCRPIRVCLGGRVSGEGFPSQLPGGGRCKGAAYAQKLHLTGRSVADLCLKTCSPRLFKISGNPACHLAMFPRYRSIAV